MAHHSIKLSYLLYLLVSAEALPGARVKVLTKLFPEMHHGMPFAALFKPSFESKRVAALRWRVSQQRAEVEWCSQQITGLEIRLGLIGSTQGNSRLTPVQRGAAEHEVRDIDGPLALEMRGDRAARAATAEERPRCYSRSGQLS